MSIFIEKKYIIEIKNTHLIIVRLIKGLDNMNKLVLYTQYHLYKNNIRPEAFFSREIQLSEADPAKSSICYMDNIGYKQYWLQVWWQGIFFAWGPPNARKIVIFTFSIEHPFF